MFLSPIWLSFLPEWLLPQEYSPNIAITNNHAIPLSEFFVILFFAYAISLGLTSSNTSVKSDFATLLSHCNVSSLLCPLLFLPNLESRVYHLTPFFTNLALPSYCTTWPNTCEIHACLHMYIQAVEYSWREEQIWETYWLTFFLKITVHLRPNYLWLAYLLFLLPPRTFPNLLSPP